ncbi:NADH-cytochrome b5 reductase-like [Calliopsis andreniformis]|uniref:NADH-cytochrome b5 reductase-like n=1 Tax=Calliopsis andreniformis TaxID=337506 RepID=UPI003FCCAD3D
MYANSNGNDGSSRPVTPSEDDCCHNACEPCIFDIHKTLLEEYEKRKRQNIKTKARKNVLCSFSYENFIVTNVKDISESYILLVLKHQKSQDDTSILIDPGQHVMLHLHDTTKPFTPIFWTDSSIHFLIRLYSNGKFSSYIKNIKINDKIRVRGPYGNFKYKFNSFQKIIMFSMGSGIAAVYPIAKSIIDNEFEETKIDFIGGFQSISQIPLKKELQVLSDYWNFICTLYISQSHNDSDNLHGITIKFGRLNKESLCEILENNIPSTTLVLICGTPEFNKSVEQWTRSLNYTHIHVFK